MEVFISWSGERSGKVAEALRDWLPSVIQSVEPFMSASDIDKGSRWSNDLATHLEVARFGLICLTQDNLEAAWLLFESGALSKSIESSRVVPYLYGVPLAQLQGPLAQFQAAVATKDSTWEVLKSINEASGDNGLELTRLERAFENWWPDLEDSLNGIPEPTVEALPPRPEREILEEVLYICRQMSRQGVPSLESEQETLRNFMADWVHAEPVESTHDLHAENRQIPTETERIELLRRRIRLLTRNARQLELERLRRIRDRLAHGYPSSESEGQSSSDADKRNVDLGQNQCGMRRSVGEIC